MAKSHGDQIYHHNQATRRLYDTKFPDNQEFRGVDGEGGNVPEEDKLFGTRHQYLSLRCGPDLLETGKPLSWLDCFSFLADQPKGFQYVAYFFDYDVTMMIRTLPKEVAAKLLNRHLRISQHGWYTPVEYEGFQFDYMAHKEFRVRRVGQKYWVVINDVGQFFQKPFLDTITKWNIGTEEERAFIKRGKEMRADFAETTDETRAYNALECLLLEQLMTHFRAVCWETGYVPRKWQGPGYLASAMLDYHHVPRREEIPILSNKNFRALAQAAYYGGRFETTAVGPIRGPIWQYDINGAYVYLLTTLPCLTHGTWRRVRNRPSRGLYFGSVHFNHGAHGLLLSNLPIRMKSGNIWFPREGNGVYWSSELTSAEAAGTRIEFREGWEYIGNCDCRWFDFVESYYRQRLALGKSAKGYVLKLAGNSIYGKIAQSIGYAPYANPIWAGMITAGCRAMLIDAYGHDPIGCYMLATDGIFMDHKLDLPISKNLGDWEETCHEDGMFIAQPGIYFAGAEPKSRGVPLGRVNEMRPEFEAQWEKFVESRGVNHTVDVEVTNFITAKQAIARNKWDIAGMWEKDLRQLSFDWSAKRMGGMSIEGTAGTRTTTYPGDANLHSVPYGRLIGGGLIMADQEKHTRFGTSLKEHQSEQPDWVQPMLTGFDEDGLTEE